MRRLQAFSLIELMIVVALLSIMTGGALVAFNNFRQRTIAKEEVDKATSYLRGIARQATAGQTPSSCSNKRLDRYALSWSETVITVTAVCELTNAVVSSLTLSNVLVGASVSGLNFGTLRGGADNEMSFYFCPKDGGMGYSVLVNRAGFVNDPVKDVSVSYCQSLLQ